MEPVVLALEKDYGEKANVIVVDVDSQEGQILAQQFNIYYIPAVFIFDQQGQITYKDTGPQSKAVLENALNSGNKKESRYAAFFQETIPDALASGGLPILVFVFLGGVLTSLSPCILSMLPVMLGYIGGLAKPTKTKGFIVSGFFVLGLAVTFSILGISAALLGKVFGQIGPAWPYIIGLLAIVMGLQLMGVLNIELPGLKIMPEKRGGVLGPFGVGLLFGLVASPCATPVLAVLMTYVAGQGVLWYGALLLFIYGLGHGLPLLVAGTFTALLKSLPRFMRWSRNFTYLSGGILILVGLYFLARAGW
ncbi:cytochrome c biogenesis protein CcdA [Desulfosporosinus sp. PR]|uniref:cytochrome c biogenesis protein CcdA n=1 Tax=Candidatus Desulfosporosinus nitrosoreducens TaxID=3401928 RepID=UPI0027ECB40D|nr:cytochrome c biogenesis protein CcdA [Desulfosporosinus sp. PR]MDQ7093128.1 cytochrome c biogenesis protein CcdA [Desulfosporosinus sp. PR]